MIDPFTAQWMAEERRKDALREAEDARLIRAAKGPRRPQGRRLPVALILSRLLSLFMR